MPIWSLVPLYYSPVTCTIGTQVSKPFANTGRLWVFSALSFVGCFLSFSGPSLGRLWLSLLLKGPEQKRWVSNDKTCIMHNEKCDSQTNGQMHRMQVNWGSQPKADLPPPETWGNSTPIQSTTTVTADTTGTAHRLNCNKFRAASIGSVGSLPIISSLTGTSWQHERSGEQNAHHAKDNFLKIRNKQWRDHGIVNNMCNGLKTLYYMCRGHVQTTNCANQWHLTRTCLHRDFCPLHIWDLPTSSYEIVIFWDRHFVRSSSYEIILWDWDNLLSMYESEWNEDASCILAHPIGLPRPFSSFSSSPAYVPASRYVDTSFFSISAWHSLTQKLPETK